MAQRAVRDKGAAVRVACAAFGISETCYRYQPKLSAENIAKGSDQSTLIAQSPDTLYAPESDFPEKSL